ncbi:MAG: sialate O-acetylesterase [Opitutales bacterium]
MKLAYFIYVLLSMCGVLVSSGADKHLFLLSGQSNMARMDPLKSFTPAIREAFGSENVTVIKVAQKGQPIRRWYKGWEFGGTDEDAFEIGDIYDRLMAQLEGVDTKSYASITFLWMQGERDAKEGLGEFYEQSLRGLIEQLKDDLGRDSLNFVIGRLSDSGFAKGENPAWRAVRNAHVAVADADSRGAWVDTDDLNDGTRKNGKPWKYALHYTDEGYVIFGERLAKSAIQLIESHR